MGDASTHKSEAGEVVLQVFSPAVRSVAVRSLKRVILIGVLVAAGAWASPWIVQALGDVGVTGVKPRAWIVGLGILGVLLKVGYEALLQVSRRYTLTTKRMVAASGVFRRTTVEIPLERVQQVVLDRTVLERLTGLGTLCVTSAGSMMIDLAWVMVKRPGERLAQVREALDGASVQVRLVETPCVRLVAEASSTTAREKLQRPDKEREQFARLREAREGQRQVPVAMPTHPREEPLVIGLAGGIGSGKSAVANVLASLGALVTDSDKQARAALDLPEVRARLLEWWGPGVVVSDGTTDRKAIAKIVFESPKERARLEGLIHPMVKANRAELVERAKTAGVAAVVIDAPLLFEAGLEKECDAVFFVHAPREQRLARVRATRGWDEAELARREKAQLALEEKRRRADVVIENSGDLGALRDGVAKAYRDVLERGGIARDKSEGKS